MNVDAEVVFMKKKILVLIILSLLMSIIPSARAGPVKGTIIVKKIIDLGKVGGYSNDIYFEFVGDVTGSITHGDEIVKSDLDAGIYKITELNAGWVTSIEFDDPSGGSSSVEEKAIVDLAAGETVIVTYTNRPPGFAIPEFPLGTIGGLVTMLGVVLLLRNKKLSFLTQ